MEETAGETWYIEKRISADNEEPMEPHPSVHNKDKVNKEHNIIDYINSGYDMKDVIDEKANDKNVKKLKMNEKKAEVEKATKSKMEKEVAKLKDQQALHMQNQSLPDTITNLIFRWLFTDTAKLIMQRFCALLSTGWKNWEADEKGTS